MLGLVNLLATFALLQSDSCRGSPSSCCRGDKAVVPDGGRGECAPCPRVTKLEGAGATPLSREASNNTEKSKVESNTNTTFRHLRSCIHRQRAVKGLIRIHTSERVHSIGHDSMSQTSLASLQPVRGCSDQTTPSEVSHYTSCTVHSASS